MAIQHSIAEKTWLEFCKVKWPSLVIGSEAYNQRRKAYYVGLMTALGFVIKTPDSALDTLLPQLLSEVKAELKREDKEILPVITIT